MPAFSDLQRDAITQGLSREGYVVLDNYFPAELIRALSVRSDELGEQNFKAAGVGRLNQFQVTESVRSDRIYWISGDHPCEQFFLNTLEELRLLLNRYLFLGLVDYESHFARYASGAFYQKHKDAFRSANNLSTNRRISTVLYLNEDWQATDGGELVIYNNADERLEAIQPLFGRFVIFLSEEFPHEVLPALRERKSIAGWFRGRSN